NCRFVVAGMATSLRSGLTARLVSLVRPPYPHVYRGEWPSPSHRRRSTMANDVLQRPGLGPPESGGPCATPLDRPSGPAHVSIHRGSGEVLGRVLSASTADYDRVAEEAQAAFLKWRSVPPPIRGEVVRRIGIGLRERQQDLGLLVTLETGKVLSEGLGEVQ